MFAFFAGLAAGLLHVFSGPDHLAAVAPLALSDDSSAAYTVNAVSFAVSIVLVLRISPRLLQSERALSRGHWRDLRDGFSVTSSHLETTVRIPNADPAKFQQAAEGAKAGCPISRLLNTNITLDAKLEP